MQWRTGHTSFWSKLGAMVLVLSCVTVWSASAVSGKTLQPTEAEVKVALLYKFAKFITWPEHAMAGVETFKLAVLGENPYKRALPILEKKCIKGLPVEVVAVSHPAMLDGCHIVLVGRDWSGRMSDVASVAPPGALLVGDHPGFAAGGGVLQFILEQGRVGFAINQRAAKRQGLKISSKLLRLAHLVEPENGAIQ